ncbi:sensor histidine kinase [Halorientalis pallida]|uniref:histidine kinase n=1 Tax=Halorientalis pallida TaxID=2479928 RepID=A0A498KWW0_9EURY|nr:HAMP domain-containing sensor histidine kinase [Halorientalis pallida]RXK50111.1 HAMP domain-containing histidine kinase [Halorientalis pallida]
MHWADVDEWVIDTFFEWIVPVVSLVSLVLFVGLVRMRVDEPFFRALDLVLPALFVTLMVYQGLKLHERSLTTERRRTVAVWYALGIYTMVGLAGWSVLLGLLGQDVPMSVESMTEIVAGGFFGLLVGIAQVRAKQNAEAATQAQLEQEFVERQQKTNEVLNRILRHHLLNGLTVVRGQAQLLGARVDEERADHAETVIDRADEMTATIEEIRDITRTLTEEPNLLPVDFGAVLREELAAARETFPEGTFEMVGSLPENCTVQANDLLGRAVANVLANAVEHNDGEDPRVEVSVAARVDAVVLSVADNGPGLPEEVQTDVFEPSERGLDSDGDGLGLFLTASVLEQYGGRAWIGDRTEGTVVNLELPR